LTQVWYFPYHEWVEVFLEPVKVTLSGVNPEHDFNSRLMLGWLSRGVSGGNIVFLKRTLCG